MCAPVRAAQAVGRLLGRRGAFLLAMGIAWVCHGYAIVATPTPASQRHGLNVLVSAMPIHAWGWLWVLSGLVAAAFSLVRRVGADQPGFTLLVIPAISWGAGYLIDWIVFGEYSRGWVVASTYAALATSIVIASGWPEVRRVRS